MYRLTVLISMFVGLSACAPVSTSSSGSNGPFISELPENIRALAAPNQNLSAVRLKPEDGCYWYQHVGPVETTMLPLRTREGRPICTRAQT